MSCAEPSSSPGRSSIVPSSACPPSRKIDDRRPARRLLQPVAAHARNNEVQHRLEYRRGRGATGRVALFSTPSAAAGVQQIAFLDGRHFRGGRGRQDARRPIPPADHPTIITTISPPHASISPAELPQPHAGRSACSTTASRTASSCISTPGPSPTASFFEIVERRNTTICSARRNTPVRLARRASVADAIQVRGARLRMSHDIRSRAMNGETKFIAHVGYPTRRRSNRR